MGTVEQRALAHKLIDEADLKLLNLVIALMNAYIDEPEFTQEEIAEMEADSDAMDRGELETITEAEFWEFAEKLKQKHNA